MITAWRGSPGLDAFGGLGQKLDPRRHVHLLVWILVVVSFGSFRSRGEQALLSGAWLDGQIVMEILIWTGLGVLAVYGLRRGWIDLGRLRFAPMALLGVFVAYAAFSSLYAPSPAFAAFRAGQLGVAFLLVMMPGVDRSLIYRAMFVYAVMSLAAAAIEEAPSSGLFGAWYRLYSMFGHPSIVGIATAVGAAGLWARWLSTGLSLPAAGAMLVLIFTNVLTVSRTAIIGMLAGMALSLALTVRIRGVVAAGWAALGIAALELFTGAVSAFLLRGQSRFEIQTLTERTVVWQATLRRLPEAGLFGEGLGSTRFQPPVETVGLGHAHNILLEGLVTLGLIGGLLLCALVLAWAWRLVSFVYRGHGSWSLRLVNVENVAIFIPLIAFCVLDRGFLSLGDPLLPVYFAAVCIAQDDNLRFATGEAVPQRRRTRRRRRVAADPRVSHVKGRSSMK